MYNMGNFNRGERSGGGRSFGDRRSFNNRGTDRPTLYKTICSKCGKDCEVPFRPTGSKPVFCRDCFRDNGGNFSRPNFDNRNGPQYKEQFEALNIKLDKILKILTPVAFVKEAEEFPLGEQAVIPEKKKRVSKKVPLTSKEQL